MDSLKEVYDKLDNYFETKADPRTTNWFLMGSPFPVLAISLVYVISVQCVLPRFMSNSKAFDIRTTLWLFNVWHLSMNIYFFYKASTLGWLTTYNWRCEPVDRSTVGAPLEIANVVWRFLIFKLTDFLETIILLCGKRYELITKYHVAHHFVMPNMIWFIVKFVPGGHATFFGLVNSFSHIIMYSYLIAIGTFPKLKHNIPWFRQFRIVLSAAEIIAIIVHTFQLVIRNDCKYPMEFVMYALVFGFLYLGLSLTCNDKNYEKVSNKKGAIENYI